MRTHPRHPDPRRGIILIAVLWIIAVIAFLGLTYAYRTATDRKAMYYMQHRMQAQLLAESAIDRARGELAMDAFRSAADDLGEIWADAPDRFADQRLEGLDEGVYSVIGRPDEEDPALVRYGLEDECGKINLNTATREMLMRLPGVTEEIADAIIDWRDTDENPGPRGAESDYYASLSTPYRCKNADFESIDELLLVRGVTSRILYGEDANRNGRLDPNEDDGDENPPDDDGDGELDRGLYRFVTIWSSVPNTDADGQPRVFLNQSWQQLAPALAEVTDDSQVVQQIVARRRQGTFESTADLLDLPAVTAQVYGEIADRVTVSQEKILRGLINPNTASAVVLGALPGLTEEDVAALVAIRQEGQATDSVAWPLQVISKDAYKGIANLLTVRSLQFSCEAVGRFTNRPVFKRIWVVLDRSSLPAGSVRIVYWQDRTGFGVPYPRPEPDLDYSVNPYRR